MGSGVSGICSQLTAELRSIHRIYPPQTRRFSDKKNPDNLYARNRPIIF
ncbi:hypothetical protein B4098_2360 [Heyndrickxia coagulans]|uniref:Uncharacterized protein n=1 Tax=Heyndrickxia coagulans TaxID=1398 RepID=A0A150JQH6_HEYCO|nr:hypothetical protein B4100_2524 [Heyndrickxia coagulans]KYC60060.1 hypothetical protein B4098_2360 [Heyndrickxia coagulans]